MINSSGKLIYVYAANFRNKDCRILNLPIFDNKSVFLDSKFDKTKEKEEKEALSR